MRTATTAAVRQYRIADGVVIEKFWDGNERVTEDAHGRAHVSGGRWQWALIMAKPGQPNGVTVGSFDRKREAVAAAMILGGAR